MSIPISVITVNLNNVSGLEKTIKSVFNQTRKNIEYIIIDGGSTDGSVELLNKNADKFTYWVSQKDAGIYNAMNKGWKKASGNYCIFLNSGDYLFENTTIEQVEKEIDSTEIIFGDIIREKGNMRVKDIHPQEYSLFTLLYKNLPHQGCFIKRTLLEKLGGYDEEFQVLADWVFYNRAIIEENAKIKKVNHIISVFEMGGISNTVNSDDEGTAAIKKHFPFMEDIYETFKRLRYYELSRPHQALEKVLKVVKNLTV